ncbi:ATP phosphoribosyltransferase regulatory subunit [Salimicrobium halophilum]|uniref:ATP phosphoribosyltransferase regulatory subunit n=1 Tax=Salimicrobium halophilum TaxID=86666 RepID=A0A1G8V551_9BACI|nr:ATP phosphoribosyltransferase regulatory subunit [Salimicrobium halophilum]SDJ61212.1 ATP phosphoribosyltransferase regulatory subunit [Salimicrobium halophilum]
MAKKLMFEKPLGMRDTLPFFYNKKENVRTRLTNAIESFGYQFMDTPLLEYHETVGKVSATLDQQLFKLLDQQGHTLVLRPDMTAPIARVAASQLKEDAFPLRLAYDGSVFRAQQSEAGKPAQFEQVGTELIGDHSSYGDAEVIALLIESLKQTGLEEFVITVGHIGFVRSLFEEVLPQNNEAVETLLEYLYRKNYVGYKSYVASLSISEEAKNSLTALLRLRGSDAVFEEARALAKCQAGLKAMNELKQLHRTLEQYGVASYVQFDLNLISHMDYYTGILFEGYAPNVGALLCNGGRYDALLPSFELNASATGFAVHVERLVEALNGSTEIRKSAVCVIVDDQTFSEGVDKANLLRSENKRVVIQHADQVANLTAFLKKYEEVIDMTGKGATGDE